VAPPGTSATDQYCETLPTVNGQGVPTRSLPPDAPRLGSVLSGSLTERLREAGPLGAALLSLPAGASPQAIASDGGPVAAGSGASGETTGIPGLSPGDRRSLLGRDLSEPRSDAPGRSLGAAVRALGGGGLGMGFAGLLLASALAALAAAWFEYRRSRPR
jgi:hypothetical protein